MQNRPPPAPQSHVIRNRSRRVAPSTVTFNVSRASAARCTSNVAGSVIRPVPGGLALAHA
jgi:hypothetical protein